MIAIEKIKWKEQEIYCLQNEGFCAYINPSDGMNVMKLCYYELEVISFLEERKDAGATYGIPILFPTPNRTRNNEFVFQGKRYPAKMHGVARNAAFQVVKAAVEDTAVCLRGELKITPALELYKEFSFCCSLWVEIQLTKEELKYLYELKNEDEKDLPFGFGLHPFFTNKDKKAMLFTPATQLMQKEKDYLPTGKVVEVNETSYDLTRGRAIEELELDDVYLDTKNRCRAIITFADYQVVILAGASFTHTVIYTPKEEPFFCVEPQTCSTDAIHLYEAGERELSGLQVLKAKETAKDEVIFKII